MRMKFDSGLGAVAFSPDGMTLALASSDGGGLGTLQPGAAPRVLRGIRAG